MSPMPREMKRSEAKSSLAVAMNSLASWGNQIGLILVDLGLVSGIDGPGFLRGESQVAEALAGTMFACRESWVIGINGAQSVAVA
jgi:hypothetical protein